MTTPSPPQAPPPPLPPYPEPPAGATPPPSSAPRPPLRRSRTDKVIGGVGGGLAEYTGIDALLWRVGFIALVFAGGTGFLVYVLLWLLMPARPVDAAGGPVAAPQPAEPRSPVPGITVAALLLSLGVVSLVAWLTPWDPGPVVFLGTALLVVGVGLGVGAFVGGRSSRGPLITLGVLLSFAVVVASAGHGFRDRAPGGVGDRSEFPRAADQVQSSYENGVGDLDLDLTNIDLADLTGPITTSVNAGIGDVEVVVPRSADVQVDVQNGVGEADVLDGGSRGGFFPGTGGQRWTDDGTPEIVLTIESGIGDVTVTRG
ncbi:phage shock protein C (PspC) family protein [Klenkia marina]|uniref:Phage shock protein C (PspC) family protein n=1 Tax=Klenkia marina TaxID=1960309 RepID=A0A1G4Y155_9ACTN|nr:PspC domain-containing protein [Klenkia marina]SCX47177.1 phage shock protein C (PspC) family protein [Klenkia marina]